MTTTTRNKKVKENVIEDIMSDQNFKIVSESHRQGLLEIFSVKELMALEDFLRHRAEDHAANRAANSA